MNHLQQLMAEKLTMRELIAYKFRNYRTDAVVALLFTNKWTLKRLIINAEEKLRKAAA